MWVKFSGQNGGLEGSGHEKPGEWGVSGETIQKGYELLVCSCWISVLGLRMWDISAGVGYDSHQTWVAVYGFLYVALQMGRGD